MSIWEKLVPKEYGFYDFFARHSAALLDGARTFAQLMDEWPEGSGRLRRIEELEHECDTIAHMTLDLLHRTFITPLDREEIQHLVSRIDDVMDLIDGASRRLALFEVKAVPPKMRELSKVLLRGVERVDELVRMLRKLDDVERMRALIQEIHRLENEGDGLHRAGLAELFRESASDPLTVIKLKEIFEVIEAATDRCEDAADVIEGVLLEHT